MARVRGTLVDNGKTAGNMYFGATSPFTATASQTVRTTIPARAILTITQPGVPVQKLRANKSYGWKVPSTGAVLTSVRAEVNSANGSDNAYPEGAALSMTICKFSVAGVKTNITSVAIGIKQTGTTVSGLSFVLEANEVLAADIIQVGSTRPGYGLVLYFNYTT